MHEYLTYYSPTLNQHIHLGDKYGSPIMTNNLRDYKVSYEAKGDRISSWKYKNIQSKSFKVKFIKDDADKTKQYQRDFRRFINADLTAGVKGKLYLEDQYYINCNIIAEESSEYLKDERFIVCNFTIVTDDPMFYHHVYITGVPFLNSSGDLNGKDTGMNDECIGCDMVVYLRYFGSVSSTKFNPLVGIMFYKQREDGLFEKFESQYGIGSSLDLISAGAAGNVGIDTQNRTIVDHMNDDANLFSKRSKTMLGTFATPTRGFDKIVLKHPTGQSSSLEPTSVNVELYARYLTVPASKHLGHPISSSENYISNGGQWIVGD